MESLFQMRTCKPLSAFVFCRRRRGHHHCHQHRCKHPHNLAVNVIIIRQYHFHDQKHGRWESRWRSAKAGWLLCCTTGVCCRAFPVTCLLADASCGGERGCAECSICRISVGGMSGGGCHGMFCRLVCAEFSPFELDPGHRECVGVVIFSGTQGGGSLTLYFKMIPTDPCWFCGTYVLHVCQLSKSASSLQYFAQWER